MVEAPSLKYVERRLQESFQTTRLQTLPEIDQKIIFMRPGTEMLSSPKTRTVSVKSYLKDKIKLVGILFIHPKCDLAVREVLPRINQYHLRAGEPTDFYFAGYGAYWGDAYDDAETATKVDGEEWLYSEKAFNDFCNDIEQRTKWHWSGESDLILLTARFSPEEKRAVLDFSMVATFSLEKLIADKSVSSVPAFFESIFRFGKRSGSVWDFSDLHLLKTSGSSFCEWVCDKVGMLEYYKKNRQFAIRDISKELP